MNDIGFYMVWNDGGNPPTKKHFTRSQASEEAERLARLNPGKRFVVLQSVSHVEKIDVHWEQHDSPEDKLVPF